MQRLTKNNKTFIDCDECYDERATCGYCETITKAIQKLAEYEDLEEQGLLLRLPCKVGTPIYSICKQPTKCTAYQTYKSDYECQGCEVECDASWERTVCSHIAEIEVLVRLADRFGKSIFLTKEEAEAKLREMEAGE